MTELLTYVLTWLAWTAGGIAAVFGLILLWSSVEPRLARRASVKADAEDLTDPPWERPRILTQHERGYLALQPRLVEVESRRGPIVYYRGSETGQLWRHAEFSPYDRGTFSKNDYEFELARSTRSRPQTPTVPPGSRTPGSAPHPYLTMISGPITLFGRKVEMAGT